MESLRIRKTLFGERSGQAAAVSLELALINRAQNNNEQAYRALEAVADIYKELFASGVGRKAGRWGSNRRAFIALLEVIFERLSAIETGDADGTPALRLEQDAFEVGQWADRSATAEALTQMTARMHSKSEELRSTIRRQDELILRRAELLETKVYFFAKSAEVRNSADLRLLDTELNTIEIALRDSFAFIEKNDPDYYKLASGGIMAMRDVPSHLAPTDALLSFHLSNAAVFIFCITREVSCSARVRWTQTELREAAYNLRLGLYREDKPNLGPSDLKFDGLAHLLFARLIQPFNPVLADKNHLILVATGPLAAIPFNILVTEPPVRDQAGYRSVAWLIRRFSISVLPSVASLRQLAPMPQIKTKRRAYLGIGNPVLVGASGPATGGSDQVIRDESWRADVEEVRRLEPLPDTADEIKDVADVLSRSGYYTLTLLGRLASARKIKDMSERGMLLAYGVIHFATHGLVPDEIKGLAEPALVLTPPPSPVEGDDGLMSASEIAQLDLDADWVMLSACNTAAGRGAGAEALSGLARAFFYAGARALLVSHWPVYSEAATKIITTSILNLNENPGLSRAEALRLAMVALIEHEVSSAHPSYWAPFVIVGDHGPLSMLRNR